MELISIIVPIYKAEAYLDKCIQSIAQQTYKNIEIILVDDESPDKCPEICDKWAAKDNRVIVIHKPNGGVSSSRNTGLARTNGEYIAMVDSDDYISENMIERLYIALKNNDADLSLCDFDKGKEENYIFDNTTAENEIIDAKTALERSYIDSHKALQYIAPWGKLYKKSLFDNLEYPNGKIFEDIYITHQILCRCNKIVVIDSIMTYYFQHSDSIMNKKFHIGKLDYLDASKSRIEFFKNNNFTELSEIAYDEYLHSLIWEYSRTRDILHDRFAKKAIIKRFREIYVKGYESKRYPDENRKFLRIFCLNPEIIVLYWRIDGKFKK
ncbi:MAG: glycosyltransferase [Ruminococcus sp.]|nr:glycosyltransferase [Ruminococcus sp.]